MRLLLLLAALLLVVPPVTAAASWRRPVDGPIAARFAYSDARPFARGQRRGVDFAARAGTVVVAPCTGRVAYAGAVPGRGLGVTLRCGRLTATLLGLAAVHVRRGVAVRAGSGVGRVAGGRVLRLGARVTGRRFAYVDPRELLAAATRRPRPLVPVRGPRGGKPRGAPRLRPAARPVAPWGARRAARPLRAPVLAWLGAGLLAGALGAGVALPALRRRRARRSARSRNAGRAVVRGIEG